MTKRNSVIGIGGITLDRAVSWGQTGDGTQAEGDYEGTAKRMLPCLETEFGISREAETVLPPLLSARLLTNLFPMPLCLNVGNRAKPFDLKASLYQLHNRRLNNEENTYIYGDGNCRVIYCFWSNENVERQYG